MGTSGDGQDHRGLDAVRLSPRARSPDRSTGGARGRVLCNAPLPVGLVQATARAGLEPLEHVLSGPPPRSVLMIGQECGAWPLRPEAKFADLGSAHSRIQPGPERPVVYVGVCGDRHSVSHSAQPSGSQRWPVRKRAASGHRGRGQTCPSPPVEGSRHSVRCPHPVTATNGAAGRGVAGQGRVGLMVAVARARDNRLVAAGHDAAHGASFGIWGGARSKSVAPNGSNPHCSTSAKGSVDGRCTTSTPDGDLLPNARAPDRRRRATVPTR